VAGGKLSTYRPLAMQVLRRIGKSPELACSGANRRTRRMLPATVPTPIATHLERYGKDAPRIYADGSDTLCPHARAIAGEVEHAVARELATTIGDVLMRRMGVAWHACRGLCCHSQTAALMARLLGWDAQERERQVAAYEQEVARNLPAWADIVEEAE
jgi:glycerol-3-phosphate dehydrogenase